MLIAKGKGIRNKLEDYPEWPAELNTLWDLLERCWKEEPEERPTGEEVAKWFDHMREGLDVRLKSDVAAE